MTAVVKKSRGKKAKSESFQEIPEDVAKKLAAAERKKARREAKKEASRAASRAASAPAAKAARKEKKAAAKAAVEADVLKAINKHLPKLIAARYGQSGAKSEISSVVETGLFGLDHYVLGVGGIPVGRLGEVCGDESSGKSSLGFLMLAATQRAGGVGILVVTERDLLTRRAALHGVDLTKLILAEPDTFEQALQAIKDTAASLPKRSDGAPPHLLAWDSLAASEMEGAAEKTVGAKDIPGRRALLLSRELPPFVRLAQEKGLAAVIINQLRSKIGVLFGNPETTPGGNALKFLASWRLQLWRGTVVKQRGQPTGQRVTIKAIKNKVAYPYRKTRVQLLFDSPGWDFDWSTMQLGRELGLFGDDVPQSTQHIEEVREYLLHGVCPELPTSDETPVLDAALDADFGEESSATAEESEVFDGGEDR